MFEPGKSISIDDIINASEKLGPEADEPKKAAVVEVRRMRKKVSTRNTITLVTSLASLRLDSASSLKTKTALATLVISFWALKSSQLEYCLTLARTTSLLHLTCVTTRALASKRRMRLSSTLRL
jgi:hypothetical protein